MWAALLLGLLLALGVASPASGRTLDMQPVGTAEGWVLGDGERFVAWHAGGSVTVLDDRGPTRSFELESACPPAPAWPEALGSGLLLVETCPSTPPAGQTHLVVYDLRTGARHSVAPPRRAVFANLSLPQNYGGDDSPRFTDIGLRWIEAWTGGNHWSGRVYHDWRTGQVINDSERLPEQRATVPDVDRRGLHRRLCGPLKRPPTVTSFDQEPHYADVRYNGRLAVYETRTGFAVWRCGAGRPSRVSRCADGCYGLELTRGHIGWWSATRVRVLALATGRVYDARHPGGNPGFALSSRRLIVTGGDGDRTVYAARLPRR